MLETLIALIAARSALELYTGVDLGPYRLNVPSLFGLALLGVAAVFFIQRRRTLTGNPLLWGWAVWLATLVPSVAIGFALRGDLGFFGVREWVRLLSLPAVFLVAYNLPPRRGWRSGLTLLLLVLPIPLAAAFVQMALHTGLMVSGRHRVMGTLFHPNTLALFLVFFVGLTFWKVRASGRRWWLLLIMAELIVFVATLSLSGLLMLAGLGTWIGIREDRRGRALLVALGIFVALLFAANGQARTRIRAVRSFAPERIRDAVQDGRYIDSLGWRYNTWAQLIPLWRARPAFGWGLGASPFINPTKHSGVGLKAHNDLIGYLVETGVVGLLTYCGFVAFCLFQMMRAASRRVAEDSLAWILTGIFLASQLGSLGDNVIANSAFQLCLWTAWGFALGRQR